MKKYMPYVVIFLLLVAICHAINLGDVSVHLDDGDFDGPGGTLLGFLLAGGGLLFGAVVLVCAAIFTAIVLAGLGVMMVVGMALVAVILAALVFPVILPLLLPLLVIWFIVSRVGKNRRKTEAV